MATARLISDTDADSGDLDDYLGWLGEGHAGRAYSPATFATLGPTLGELRCHQLVRGAAANPAIRAAIRNADQLLADYGARR